MKDREYELQMQTIAEILEEAQSFGLRHEVEQTALKYMEENTSLSVTEAYSHAFNYWIK